MRSIFTAIVVFLVHTVASADRFGIEEAADTPVSLWGSLLWIAVLVLGYILFRKK